MAKFITTDEELKSALSSLKALCPLLAPLIDLENPPALRKTEGGFIGLLRIIVFQQISIYAGRSIWDKFLSKFPSPSPLLISEATEDELRAAGLSRPKIRTMKALAEAILTNSVTQQDLLEGNAEALTKVKGIGAWTATVYRLTALGDADVFPAGDIALQEQMKVVLGLNARPNEKQAMELSIRWQPYRAVASRVLWQVYTQERMKKASDLPI